MNGLLLTYENRYEVNFEPQSGIMNDLYQGYLRTPPGEWTTLALPLKRFILTGQGQIRDVQRKWDKHMELRSVGFTIADPVAGPFQLDVAWIALVSKVPINIQYMFLLYSYTNSQQRLSAINYTRIIGVFLSYDGMALFKRGFDHVPVCARVYVFSYYWYSTTYSMCVF